jgi:hypothetical protein
VNEKQWRRLIRSVAAIEAKLDRAIKPSFGFAVGPITRKKKENTMIEINITNEQQVKVTLNPKTETGKPAQVDGAPTWEVITGNSTVTPATDGLSADLISSDDPGDTDFLVKADADLGAGVQEISDVIRLHVAGAMAANLGLSAGEPPPKPT